VFFEEEEEEEEEEGNTIFKTIFSLRSTTLSQIDLNLSTRHIFIGIIFFFFGIFHKRCTIISGGEKKTFSSSRSRIVYFITIQLVYAANQFQSSNHEKTQ